MSAEALTSCPPDEQLACFIDGSLPPSAVAALEVHLAHCDRCCSIVAVVPDDRDADVLDGDPTEGAEHMLERERGDASRLGRYVLLERVGAGGMGVVWAAYDPELDRRVAIKLLHYEAGGSRGDKARRRLVHEARAMARVSHPNIIAVHDVVEVDDRVFMIMELVTGRTLGAFLRDPSRGWREVVELFIAAGRGLAAAHDQGVVHRDFKPDNVLVGDDGRVRVGDFGLASTVRGSTPSLLAAFEGDPADAEAARTAGFIGTPAYMAPEQFAGESIDARTDQFAFCVALWESLYGKRPFAGTSVTTLAAAVVDGDVALPPDRRSVPARIERAVRRGLARSPEARHADVRALLDELERALHGRRKRVVLATTAIGIAAIVGAIAWPRADDCASTPAWIDAGWSSTRRDALHSAAAAKGEAAIDLAGRLGEVIDARLVAMTETFSASCRAAFVDHTERVEDHDMRLACLRRSAAAVETVGDYAVTADAPGLARALQQMAALASTARCDDLESIASDLPWTGVTVDRERAVQLAVAAERAGVLRSLGDLDGARALLEEPLQFVDEPGLARVAALTLFERGMLEQRAGRGTDDFRRAFEVAVAHDNATVAYSVLSQFVFEAGVRRNDLRAAEVYAEMAMAFVEPSHLGGEASGTVLLNLAQARERAGDTKGAREALDRATAEFKKADTHTTHYRFAMYILRGLLDEEAGDLAAAERQYEHVRGVVERVSGSFHPDLAVALEYLTIVRRKRGVMDLALVSADRALEIRRKVLGEHHIEVAASLGARASVLLALNRLDEAQQVYEEAMPMFAAFPRQERNVALIKRGLGKVAFQRGEHEAALLLYREALAIAEPVLGGQHPELALALLGIAECERELDGNPMPSLERAYQLLSGDGSDPLERAEVELALARALLEDDPKRARDLAIAARDRARAVPEFGESPRLAAEAEALLGMGTGAGTGDP
jgi:tetratricopeptide (TPR) repeat protein